MSVLPCQFCGGEKADRRCPVCGTTLHKAHCKFRFSIMRTIGSVVSLSVLGVATQGVAIILVLMFSWIFINPLEFFFARDVCLKCGHSPVVPI